MSEIINNALREDADAKVITLAIKKLENHIYISRMEGLDILPIELNILKTLKNKKV